MKKKVSIKKYIVSGIPPSKSGVGRLMQRLIPEAKKRNYIILTKKNDVSIRSLIKKNKYFSAFYKIVYKLIGISIYNIRLLFIRKSLVVFIHPQTAGFKKLFRLLSNNNKVFYYVMDNSFFCIRSYNVNPRNEEECLRCIGNPDRNLPECKPFPVSYSNKKNIKHLKNLKNYSNDIHFLAQNYQQTILLKEHFGQEIQISTVGLDTGELIKNDNSMRSKNNKKFDFVFHGSPNIPKGLRYFVNIAKRITDKTFFIPSNREICGMLLSLNVFPSNITFNECTWETGLKEIIINSEFVFNPSLWSAPIEGAFLKSMYFNGKVITVKSQFGFEAEVSNEVDILRLSKEPKKGAEELIEYLFQEKSIAENKNRFWVEKFRSKNNVQEVFDIIENNFSKRV